ncbi:MAG: TRAP transporter substrate-binding protein [Gammaproteobacteria bacterium]|nr:TRAP transporter substrate-binding protein [Gammaproteobacteria bacterium]
MNIMIKKHTGLMATAMAAVTLIAATSATAATKWDMPTPYGDGYHQTINVRAFASDVKIATDGELDIVVHSGASLFKHPEIHRAVRTGQVPIGEMFMGILGNDDPVFKLDNIPFLASDFDQAKALWDASRSAIQASMASNGLQLLYAVPWPPQGFYTQEAISKIADLKGLKMRAYSPTTSRLAVLLESTPTTVQVPEIPQAFGAGIINAMITSPSTGVSSQAWDFVHHYTDVQAWIPKNMVFVNSKAFKRLDADVQSAVLAAASKAETRGWEMAIEETRVKTQGLADNGMAVVQPTAELQASLKAIGATMAAEWATEAGDTGAAIMADYQK